MNRQYLGRDRRVVLWASLCLMLLTACGGGGSSSSNTSSSSGDSSDGGDADATTPSASSLSLSLQAVKTFHFTWTDVDAATEYKLLENPDGASGYTEVATVQPGVQSYDLDVFLPGRVNASYILQACNANGCTDSASVSVSGNLVEAVGYVKASNTAAYDYFGYAVALSGDGNTLAVGASDEDSAAMGVGDDQGNGAEDSGAVYVFTRSGTTWTQQAYVKASNTGAYDYFGSAVTLSDDGNTLAVGASDEDSAATGVGGDQTNDDADGSGAVYVFTRSGTTWTQQAYVKASNTGASDYFGSAAVALSDDGNTLAVGASGEDSAATGVNGDGAQTNNDAGDSGAVYVFTRSGTTWTQQAYVKASNTGASDYFGSAVTLSADGNTLAVGASGEDSSATGVNGDQTNNAASYSGAVYVFTRSDSTWTQQAYVKASNTEASDLFGSAVALSDDGNTLAVGARYEDSAATGVGGDGAQTNNAASYSGAVYVFTRSGTTWAQQAYVKASNTGASDYFGYAVALSADGNTLAVGANGEDSAATGVGGDQTNDDADGSGAVYVFTRSDSTWTQQAYVKASNTAADNRFGGAVTLSADGNTLAVGASGEAGTATGVGGDQEDNSASSSGASGAVYLY